MAVITNPRKNAAHWYSRDGRPRHTTPRAAGDGDRPTTVADARKHGLLPSVTGILGVIDKPQLTTWKMRQVALHAGQVTRNEGESDSGYADRVIEVALAQVATAAGVGSEIHKALDAALHGRPVPSEYADHVRPVIEWLATAGITVVDTERVLINLEHGYGGSCDMLFRWGSRNRRHGALDYKTRKTTPGEPVAAYEQEAMQLVAYCKAQWPDVDPASLLCANVIISSTEVGRIEIVKHDPAILPAAWAAFLGAADLWRFFKRYDPRTGATPTK